MNSALLLTVLKSLLVSAEPLVLTEFETVVKPELDKLVTSVGSPDWKVVAQAFEDAGLVIAHTEIPKILGLVKI